MPKRTDIESIFIIGAGPIVIGQACEFDYSGTQAIRALKEEGYPLKLIKKQINTNPLKTGDKFTVSEILEKLDLSQSFYDDLLSKKLIKKPNIVKGLNVHSLDDLNLINAYANLHKNGVSFSVLKRHLEYEKLSEAEAYLLIEHIEQAKSNKIYNQKEIVDNFDIIRISFVDFIQLFYFS